MYGTVDGDRCIGEPYLPLVVDKISYVGTEDPIRISGPSAGLSSSM